MNSALEILKRERDDSSEQIRTLRIRIRDLDNAIAILEDQPEVAKRGRAPGDLKAIVLGKLEALDVGGSPKEIADALTRDGRPTSDASVSSTLSRLKAEGRVANRSGRWFAANQTGDSQTGESEEFDTQFDDLDDVSF
jgi:hypothetical protein